MATSGETDQASELLEQGAEEFSAEKAYQRAVEALDSLYLMSLENNQNEEQMSQLAFAIGMGKRSFLDRLQEKETFYETLPVLNKLAQIIENYRTRNEFFYSWKVRDVSDDAVYMLGLRLADFNEEWLKNINAKQVNDLTTAARHLVHSSIDFHIETAVDFLTAHREKFLEVARLEKDEKTERVLNALGDYIESPVFEEAFIQAIEDGVKLRKSRQLTYGRRFLERTIGKYGVNVKDTLNSWLSHTKHGPKLHKNLHAMRELEGHKPGIVKSLYDEFGIRNFERYPPQLLIEQYERVADAEIPYGIMVNPTNDWNGALSENFSLWLDLHNQLRGTYLLRVVEANNKYQLGRHLYQLDQRYGKKQKISFVFVGGHGTQSSIQFGGNETGHKLFVSDFVAPFSQRRRDFVEKAPDFFVSYPTIILNSCSTGAERDIAQKISKALGAKVVAPPVDASIKKVTVTGAETGKLDFQVDYQEEDGSQVIANIFEAGERKA